MTSSTGTWICCQLGAREHYAVPRALQIRGVLGEFITDLWIRPGTLMPSWPKRLHDRFHPGLADVPVKAPNVAALSFELKASATGANGWNLITQRNNWFQQQVVAQLVQTHKTSGNGNHALFAYSYAAEEIFKFARARGWQTILGQIDPGPVEEQIVARTHARTNLVETDWEPAPKEYWEKWRSECLLAEPASWIQ
jgi:hypothetical protein